MPIEAFFLPTDDGQRFCLFHPPQGEERGAVVYVHAFAEEMNKSRRMAALQSRAFAQAGYAVLQIDLLGCGDSSGEFGDASWDAWVDDVLRACEWLRARSQAPLWLWGLRGGCLVARDAVSRLDAPCSLLFWQPVVSGNLLLQQFLRLKLAGGMLSGQTKGATEALRGKLAAGTVVEIAGYALAPSLAGGLERAVLAPVANVPRLVWLELDSRERTNPGFASATTVAAWREAGCEVRDQVIIGPPFWQTIEIEEAPALLTATLECLDKTVTA